LLLNLVFVTGNTAHEKKERWFRAKWSKFNLSLINNIRMS